MIRKLPQVIAAILLLFAVNSTSAQGLERTMAFLTDKKVAEAKTEIDDVFSRPYNQKMSKAWFVRAKVYYAVWEDASLASRFPAALSEAYISLQKYAEYDRFKFAEIKLEGFGPATRVYSAFYKAGATAYNKEDFAGAVAGFSNAVSMLSFMYDKGWAKIKLDTTAALYAAGAADKLKQYDVVATHYAMLAESKVKAPGYEVLYKWLVDYYVYKQEMTTAAKFIALGKEVYPTDPYWATALKGKMPEGGKQR